MPQQWGPRNFSLPKQGLIRRHHQDLDLPAVVELLICDYFEKSESEGYQCQYCNLNCSLTTFFRFHVRISPILIPSKIIQVTILQFQGMSRYRKRELSQAYRHC